MKYTLPEGAIYFPVGFTNVGNTVTFHWKYKGYSSHKCVFTDNDKVHSDNTRYSIWLSRPPYLSGVREEEITIFHLPEGTRYRDERVHWLVIKNGRLIQSNE